jgi:hypothetical protein
MLGNEFARVRLRLDDQGHDPRLEILDLATDQRILLDPIMLATWCVIWKAPSGRPWTLAARRTMS